MGHSKIEPNFDIIEINKSYDQFNKLLEKESNRGVALISVAILDDLIEKLFRSQLLRDEKYKKTLIDKIFKVQGPLSSFWSKTLLARALGLITSDDFNDLELIRKIRNEFAHSFEDTNFDSQKIRQFVSELTSNLDSKKSIIDFSAFENRLKFIFKVSFLHGRIHGVILRLQERGKPFEIFKWAEAFEIDES